MVSHLIPMTQSNHDCNRNSLAVRYVPFRVQARMVLVGDVLLHGLKMWTQNLRSDQIASDVRHRICSYLRPLQE